MDTVDLKTLDNSGIIALRAALSKESADMEDGVFYEPSDAMARHLEDPIIWHYLPKAIRKV